MPETEQQRQFMCGICGGKIDAPGNLSKPQACEQCQTKIKKQIRSELESEMPTRRYLMRLCAEMGQQLPANIVKQAITTARAHAGGSSPRKPLEMSKAVLETSERKQLKDSDFAIPEDRAYPIHDEAHARNALTRVAQYGTPEEKKRVVSAVRKRYPEIEISKSQFQPDGSDLHLDALMHEIVSIGSDEDNDFICDLMAPEDALAAEPETIENPV